MSLLQAIQDAGSGAFGQYGPTSQVPGMSVSPDVPALSFTGNTGQVANIGAMAPMNYGMSAPVTGMTTPTGGGIDLWGRLFGTRDANGLQTMGAAPVALGALQGLGSLYMGMQQYGLAKKQLAESKRQFDMNYGAQKQMTNARLEDRQAARVASNPGAYQSVDAYMAKNGVK